MSEPETYGKQQLGSALTIDVVNDNHECNRHIVTHLVYAMMTLVSEGVPWTLLARSSEH
jgi:hypothetical protein